MSSPAGHRSLDWLNFFVAALQAGFGPFIPVYLAGAGWHAAEIGFVLSAGALAMMASQIPAGLLVDSLHEKRLAAGLGVLAIGLAALLLALWPERAPVLGAEIVHGFASCVVNPAIAAITLALVGHGAFGARVGANTRYAAIGAAAAALMLGLAGWWIADRGPLLMTALLTLPTLGALFSIGQIKTRPEEHAEHHAACRPPSVRRAAGARVWHLLSDRGLVAFAACAALFFLADAATLPFALEGLAQADGRKTDLVVSLAVIIPQLIAALFAPSFGRLAEQRGRRQVLLIGFAALPIRSVLLALMPGAIPLLVLQSLNGVSAAVFGIMVPLIAADLTPRHGYLNLAMGAIGLASGIGATLSTAVAGLIAERFGIAVTQLTLALFGLAATLLLWAAMPETHPAGPNVSHHQPA
ncbi:MAG: MFS transporter [Acetobacteraceae bacterium]|nr:MFS transporter [Acetobacteraceae bacterium]